MVTTLIIAYYIVPMESYSNLAMLLQKVTNETSAAGVLKYISRTQPTLSFANMYLKKWKLLDILLSLITNICCK